MNDNRSGLAKVLGHDFKNPDLLKLALVHPSMAAMRSARAETNQRLEFLGDRVLGLSIATMLYESFPNEEEGDMARRHTALVRRETLARVAVELDLGDHVQLAKSEQGAGGRDNPALLSDTCEAVIAAIYLDAGFLVADAFIRRHWTALMDEDLQPPQDAKTELQEYAQGLGLDLPAYTQTDRTGPQHAPVFTMQVCVGDHPPAFAEGASKRVAEQAAATILLTRLKDGEGKT
ncbi:MAG: ribonuclease III [Alphaproteobacteria bacterium]